MSSSDPSNPFAAPRDELPESSSNVGEALPAASRLRRFVANLIDQSLYALIGLPGFVLVWASSGHRDPHRLGEIWERFLATALAEVGVGFPALLFHLARTELSLADLAPYGALCVPPVIVAAFQWHLVASRGQSIGKYFLEIKIVRLDGSPVDFVRGVLLRSWVLGLLGFVPIFSPIFGIIDVFWIFWPGARCVHDHLAGTSVVPIRRL